MISVFSNSQPALLLHDTWLQYSTVNATISICSVPCDSCGADNIPDCWVHQTH